MCVCVCVCVGVCMCVILIQCVHSLQPVDSRRGSQHKNSPSLVKVPHGLLQGGHAGTWPICGLKLRLAIAPRVAWDAAYHADNQLKHGSIFHDHCVGMSPRP